MATSKKSLGDREGLDKATAQKAGHRSGRGAALPSSAAPVVAEPVAAPSYVQRPAPHGTAAASINAVISPTIPLQAPQPVPAAAGGAGSTGTGRGARSGKGTRATGAGNNQKAPPQSGARSDPTAPTSPTATAANAANAANAATDGAVDRAGIPELERMKGVGDTLNGRFVLEECIGFGGMGTVYKALDLRKLEASDRKPYIAIKVLNVQFSGHPKSLIALQREARKAQALAHPNIVAVYDFDRDGSMVYLTMEYLVGEPLSRILRASDFTGMPLSDAMPVVTGMAKALAYAHQRGFVHCDLKPANVFLTSRGEVKVIDFGIARVFQKPEEDQDATVFDAGSLGGLTPAYASPEMLEHREPDPRDDIYALACITYELVAGRHPFDRMSATQARGAGMKPLRPKHLTHRQWRALRAALSFERDTRTPSVMRYLEDLSDRRRATLIAWLIGAGVLVAVLATVALVRSRTANGTPETGTETEAGRASPATAPVGTAGGNRAGDAVQNGASTATVSPGGTAPPVPPSRVPTTPLAMSAVTPVLAGVPCSALNARVRQHHLQVQGYLSKNYGMARLKSTLGAIPGVETMNLDVRTVEENECSIVTAFAPYWIKNRQANTATSIRTRAVDGLLTEGDPLIVDLTTPPHDTYVYVDYFVRDGGVAHLLPNARARDNQAPPSYSATIGGLGNWIIGKPFGAELIAVMTTPAPLFPGLRPEYESTADYLRDVTRQLRQLSEKYGPDRLAVDFVRINTKARKP